MPKRTAILFASWGWRVVSVALSLKRPYPSSKQWVRMADWRDSARDRYSDERFAEPEGSHSAREAPVWRVW